ncbi:hypothetical protein SARC_06463 [Sphaeroforma arctica JP610]|uniref:Uncharacterized protein n=1 Tax=Sphaeroforma arctica JP610 TaxID=667725 RepID=A0A0L0FWK9_9EUKA|nr:hypothetical protein SARC_06463 [Sphaeroforma arctica JP610]KNC81202.1 hypothetical protein SARC_06463 [Sphaeroforma arctica JP610]|eukprot:XP_014155104.1 hypothetical protein SARC_06463 [Sphaeroforma arctica JP610]
MVAQRRVSYSFLNVADALTPLQIKSNACTSMHGMKRCRSSSSAGLLADDEIAGLDIIKVNTKYTPRCSLPNVNRPWPSLKGKSGCTYNHTLALQELRRVSLYRMQAHDMDLLRPFLLLASMPPVRRHLCASHLHLENVLKECEGDAHAEAWCILAHKRNGIVPRTAKSAGVNLNMSGTTEHEADDCGTMFSWFEVMDTVAKSAAEDHTRFHRRRASEAEQGSAGAEVRDEHVKSREKVQDKLKRCEETADVNKQTAIRNLEELLIAAVLAIGTRVIGDSISKKVTALSEGEAYTVLGNRFKEVGHFTNPLVLKTMIGESYLSDDDRIQIVKSLGGFWLKRKEERCRDVSRLGVDALLIQMSPATQSPLGSFFTESILRSMILKQKAAEPFPVIVALCIHRAFLAQGGIDLDQFCY